MRIQFKDPDTIYDIIKCRFPKDDEDMTPKELMKREKFLEDYFEFGDYGMIDIDPTSLKGYLLPKSEW